MSLDASESPVSQGSSGGGRPSAAPALLTGLIAGLLAFGLGEVLLDWFPPADVPQTLSGSIVMKPTVQTIAVADGKNAALAFAVLGGTLGLLMGLAGRLANPARPRSWKGAALGLLLGAACGAVLPLALFVPYNQLQQRYLEENLMVPLVMHAVFWGTLGAVGGLAYGVGRGSSSRARLVLFGFLGACLGTGIYEVVGATMSPLALTTEPISRTWATRLLARLLVGLGTGAAIGLAGEPSPRAPGSSAPKPAA